MSEVNDADESIIIQQLNHTLRDLFLLWFSVGFLHMERITWESACDILQKVTIVYKCKTIFHVTNDFPDTYSAYFALANLKVSDYEAIHPMRNWLDLKRRVGPYRRCYIFTHPSMPREPLVVLHTALCDIIPGMVQNEIYF